MEAIGGIFEELSVLEEDAVEDPKAAEQMSSWAEGEMVWVQSP